MADEAPRPTLWQYYLCRWRRYHTWHDGACIVCGIGVFANWPQMAGEAEKARRLGQRLRWARGSTTQRELAVACGVDLPLLRRIEAGASLPSIPLMARLCEALRVSPQFLLYGEVDDGG